MNWNHINAVMVSTGISRHSLSPTGEHLITNGHIALISPEPFPEGLDPYKPLGELWALASTTRGMAQELGQVGCRESQYHKYARSIGAAWINEAYYRCFAPVTWYKIDGKDYVIAREGEKLAGIVMPVRESPAYRPLSDPPDAEVFAALAGKENEWYLASTGRLNAEYSRITDELNRIRERLDELEADQSVLEADRDSIEARLGVKFDPFPIPFQRVRQWCILSQVYSCLCERPPP